MLKLYIKRKGKEMINCIFCKIINGEIPAKIYYEDEEILSFADINPEAPFHILIIPKKHIVSSKISSNKDLVGKLISTAYKISKKEKLTDGFRLIMNFGKDSGQIVEHIHFHVLGGKDLGSKLLP
jgi:histidine triad (HIT) family protein